MGLGEWLFFSGTQQISSDIRNIELLLKKNNLSSIEKLIIHGRRRELIASKKVIQLL